MKKKNNISAKLENLSRAKLSCELFFKEEYDSKIYILNLGNNDSVSIIYYNCIERIQILLNQYEILDETINELNFNNVISFLTTFLTNPVSHTIYYSKKGKVIEEKWDYVGVDLNCTRQDYSETFKSSFWSLLLRAQNQKEYTYNQILLS